MVELSNPFFVIGGTLRPDARSYIERAADAELFDALCREELCYVLTSRQMGKSSLMVRTAARLRREGHRVVVLDLTAVGQNLTAEQWYRSLLDLVGEQLDVEAELARFWDEHRHLGPFRRFIAALQTLPPTLRDGREVPVSAAPGSPTPAPSAPPALQSGTSHLILFIDELDAVQSLPFSSDEFFAGIRELHNRRSELQASSRITFCLLGVAVPADLVRDPRSTPFNVGRRIELTDFTPAEAQPLALGLQTAPPHHSPLAPRITARDARRLLDRVLHWTSGHPYLTQRLCQAVAEVLAAPSSALRRPPGPPPAMDIAGSLLGGWWRLTGSGPAALVDRVCRELFLAPGARKRDPNLHLVHERLLRADADPAALLDLYARVREGQSVPDLETNRLASLLQLSGVVSAQGGRLRTRNRIYGGVFNRDWIREHLPSAEQRRQQAAFRRGLTRAALVSGVILSLVTGLAGWAVTNEREANGLAERLRLALADREAALAERERALAQLRQALENVRRERNRVTVEAARARHSELREKKERRRAEELRQAAEGSRRQAEQGRRAALRLQEIAERQRTENRERLVRVSVANGNRLVSEGRPYEALLWMVQALRLDERKDAQAHRMRIASLLRESPSLEHVWSSEAPANHLILSADGTRAAAEFADWSVRLWDTRTGKQVGPLYKHTGALRAFSFSADSRRLVLAGADAPCQVIDAVDGRLVCPPLRQSGELRSAELSPDGNRLITVYEKEALLWDLKTGRPVKSPLTSASPVLCAAFSPDGRLVASAGEDGKVRLWRLSDGEYLPQVMRARPADLRFSPDGRWLVGKHGHGAVVWEVTSGKLQMVIPEGHIHALEFSGNSLRLATASAGEVRVWDLLGGGQTGRVMKHGQFVLGLAFDPVGTRLQTVTSAGTVRVWHPIMGEEVAPPCNLPGPGWSVALDPRRDRVLLSRGEGLVQLWNLATAGAVVQSHHPATRLALRLSDDGQRVLAEAGEGTLQVLDAANGQPVGASIRPGAPVLSTAFAASAQSVAIATPGGGVSIWEVTTGKCVGQLRMHDEAIQYLQFTAGDRRLLCVGERGTTYLRDLATGEDTVPAITRGDHRPLVAVAASGDRVVAVRDAGWVRVHSRSGDKTSLYDVYHRDVRTVAFSPDGNLLMTGGGDRTVRLWHSRTGLPYGEPIQHDSLVVYAGFSPDGRYLVICGENQSARVWRVADRQPIAPVLRHAASPTCAAFSPGSDRLVTLTTQGLAQLWDVHSGEAITVPTRIGQGGGRCWFAPDGQRVLLALSDGDVHVWKPISDGRPVSSLQRLAEALAAQRLDWKAGLQAKRAEAMVAAWREFASTLPRGNDGPERDTGKSRVAAHQLEQAGVWAGAAAHLDRVIREHPREVSLRHRRSRALAEIGRYTAAADDLAAAMEMGSRDRHAYYRLAMLRLAAGELEAYQRVCAAMLDYVEAAGGVHEKDLTAWTCGLGANTTANLQRAYKLIQELLSLEPHNPDYHHTRGVLLYRMGSYPAAVAALRVALGEARDHGSEMYHLSLVLALRRSGEEHSAEAKQSLALARRWMVRTESTSAEIPVHWTDRTERMLLLRELDELDRE